MYRAKIQKSLLFLMLLAGGCQSSNTKQNIVQINLVGEPHALDPRLARDPQSQTLLRMFFEGLTRVGQNDEPQLALAKGVEISEDLKTYTFTLRESKWSNGDPVKASDFVYAWRKTLSPGFPSDNAYQLYVLKNGQAVKEGSRKVDELGVLAVDERTLLVELEYPTPYVLELFAMPFFFPVNQLVDERQPKWAEKQETYVGNGPFLLSQWRHHDEIRAEKNPDYWEANIVQIDGIEIVMLEADTEMSLFEKKQLHWAGSPLSQIPVDAINSLKKKQEVFVKPMAETAFLRVNTKEPLLDCPKVRRALALAIDREAIVEHVTQGGQLPAMRLVPPSMLLQQDPYFKDGATESAVDLFNEVLEEQELSKQDFSKITLLYISSKRAHLIAQAIQQQWEKAFGVRIGLESVERKIYFDRLAHQNFDLAFCSWGADFHDPVNFLEVFKYKSQSTNNTHWEDPEYIQILNDSYRLTNPDDRYQALAKCEKILMDAMPIIPIFHYSMLYVKDKRLNDVFLSSLGGLDFKWASLENEN